MDLILQVLQKGVHSSFDRYSGKSNETGDAFKRKHFRVVGEIFRSENGYATLF